MTGQISHGARPPSYASLSIALEIEVTGKMKLWHDAIQKRSASPKASPRERRITFLHIDKLLDGEVSGRDRSEVQPTSSVRGLKLHRVAPR
jgi:hypothetical protein